jgi:hypothetical protein
VSETARLTTTECIFVESGFGSFAPHAAGEPNVSLSFAVDGCTQQFAGYAWPMVRLDSKRFCWTSPKGHHNRWSLMAVVANQAVAFNKSMLTVVASGDLRKQSGG